MSETDSDERFSFRISLDHEADRGENPVVPDFAIFDFQRDGFVVVQNVLKLSDVDALNERLENILRGDYDRGKQPDKAPRLLKSLVPDENTAATPKNTGYAKGPLGFSGNLQNVKVLQLINVHKSDHLFRALATSRALGKVVAELAGWKGGARLAQDQIWAKPPAAPPLVFHRDSPYFMFDDPAVVTVWVALDTMDAELGPLEYVKGSHHWGEGRVGTSRQFYQHTGGMKLMLSAAASEGLSIEDLEIISMAGLKAGGITIHDGRTWHGSGKNASDTRPRRGLGLHFVPTKVKFTSDARHSKLWRPYWEMAADELPEDDFPITWQPT